MKVHDMTVGSMLEIIPEANPENSGQQANFANETICMYAQDASDSILLGITIATEVPGIIDNVLPLQGLNYGWDDAHTFTALVPIGSRGIVQFEKGMDDKTGSQNDCYYIRFFSFQTADVPFTGSSKLIKDICDALAERWPNTKIISDGNRDSYTRIANIRRSEKWRSQGLCQYCGGQLGMFKKCKNCGRKN